VTSITLSRIDLDDVGVNPRRLAEAIHIQLGERPGAVPVKEIAAALDIHEIREQVLTSIEAALVTTPERDSGSILVNLRSGPQRRRFSIGHELYHFLNPFHVPTSPNGFWCSRSDMIAATPTDTDRHLRQESEANAFSIELLAPRKRMRGYLRGKPDLSEVLRAATDLDISSEAAARRYVDLHPESLAAVFCADGKFLYASRNEQFPPISLRKGQPITLPDGREEGRVSRFVDVDASEWIYRQHGVQLTAQTLFQSDGRSTTLLRAVDQDADDSLEDTYERLSGFDRSR
jgi:hypothetical protein